MSENTQYNTESNTADLPDVQEVTWRNTESIRNHTIVSDYNTIHMKQNVTDLPDVQEFTQCNTESIRNHTIVSEYNMKQNVTDLPDVEVVRVVFGRCEEELDSLGELDSAERRVGEVEEDSQDHGYGDQPQTLVGQGS